MSTGMSLKEAQETIKFQNEHIMQLSKEKCALQAKIDALMLEFCPQEMTKEQIERWQESQDVSTYSTKDNVNESLKDKIFNYYKTTDCMLGEISMSLKSEMHCPTSGNAKRVTIEDAQERLARRELRKQLKLEQNNIVITTGDDVSNVVWTEEKLEELQRVVDKIKKEEQDSIRYSFELSGIKVSDTQWNQIKEASKYYNDDEL